MKKYLFMLVIAGLFSCNSSKKTTDGTDETSPPTITVNEGSCPEKGDCSFQIKHGTSFTVATDGTGAMYPKYNEGNGVAEFRYEEKGPEGTADGDYTEVIQFNIPSGIGDGKSYSNEALQDVNLLYYKQCFCKGQAGYYKVTKGALKVFHNKAGELNFDLQFTLDGVNQSIHRIVRQ